MDYSKYDMTNIWASAGDIVAPDAAKINAGWGVEVVPRQWWNWFENRQDQNIAYILQKGLPEWDSTTEYIANKSYVTRNGIVYRATSTNTNSDPIALTSWVRAFADYSVSSNALGGLTPAANTMPYYTSTTAAAVTALTAFARTLLDDTDAATMRATLSAQQANTNLTALSGVTASANALPYFTGTTAMGVATLTSFGRSLIASLDAVAARALLEVDSSATTSAALTAGLATRQPLSSTLTALASTAAAANKLPYFNGTNSAATTDFTTFGRSLVDDVDAATARTTLEVDSSTTSAANLAAGLDTRQPLSSTLTSLADLTQAANKLPYFTGANTSSTTDLTSFGRSLIDDASAAAARTTLEVDSAATVASNLSSGLATKQALNSNLTAWSGLTPTANTLFYWTSASAVASTSLTTFGRTLLGSADALSVRTAIGSDVANNLTSGTIPLDRIPKTLTGVNAATATALQTARTIQGVSFNGTADITLPVVPRDSATGAASMPAGNTSQRPATPQAGMMRYNSDSQSFEGYQGGQWAAVGGVGAPFVSDPIAIVNAGSITVSHGLPTVSTVRFVLACVTAEAGYIPGQYIADVSAIGAQGSGGANRGISLYWSGNSDVSGKFGASGFSVLNATAGGLVSITNANWRIIVSVYP